MRTFLKAASAVSLLTVSVLGSATPALADGYAWRASGGHAHGWHGRRGWRAGGVRYHDHYHRRGGVSTGAAIGIGMLGIGVGAAAASANNPPPPPPPTVVYERRYAPAYPAYPPANCGC